MKSYGQWCALAKALEVVGERWTLLIARELLDGPKRYTDLLEGIPGISTDVLAARLKDLEEEGVATRRTLPPPAASKVYELTEMGAGLAPAVSALTRWGLQFLGDRSPDEEFRPHWLAGGLRALMRADEARGVDLEIDFDVGDGDGAAIRMRVRDGDVRTVPEPDGEPDLVVHADLGTLADLADGALSGRDAFASGRLAIEGVDEAIAVYRRLFRSRVS